MNETAAPTVPDLAPEVLAVMAARRALAELEDWRAASEGDAAPLETMTQAVAGLVNVLYLVPQGAVLVPSPTIGQRVDVFIERVRQYLRSE